MKFINTYTYQPSNFLYLGMIAFSMVSILMMFIMPMSFDTLLFIASAIGMHLLFLRSVYLKNKLMVGVNSEGFCIWQSGQYLQKKDTYLFLPWTGINNIAIKQKIVFHQKYNYVYISYRQGGVLSVASSTTYTTSGREIDLEIVSMAPSHQRHFEFYIPLDHIKGFETTVQAMSGNNALIENKQDSTAFPKN